MRKPSLALVALALSLSAGLAAMGTKPHPVQLSIQKAAASWRAADLSSCAEILEPLAWADSRAAREWAAFLFLQQRYRDLEVFFASTATAAVRDDEARLWLARAQLNIQHLGSARITLESLSQTARPLAQALMAEARGQEWPGHWPAALSATTGTRWEASTALAAGEQAEAARAFAESEALYKRAEKADPAYSLVHARLARLYALQARPKDQRTRLERALRVDPDNKPLRQQLTALVAAEPHLKASADKAEAKAVERFLKRENPTVKPWPTVTGEPIVRIGLVDVAPRFRLKLGGAYWVEGAAQTLPAKSAWEARLGAKGGWDLRPLRPNAEPLLNFSQVLRLQPLDPGSTFGLYDVDSGAGYFWASKENRYYRGIAELRPQKAKGITLVNELGMEAYLFSVVPSEVLPYWPAASLEAQAVAARSDAWRARGRFAAKGYDLCPTVACAVYSGVGVEDARSTHAVTKTAGRVLEGPNGKLHPTFYMHHSGGHTQEPSEAWISDERVYGMSVTDAPEGAKVRQLFPLTPAGLLHFLDDLDGDIDVWARQSSGFRWTLRFGADEADQWAERRHKVTPLIAVLPGKRTVGGHVEEALFIGERGESMGSSDHLRSALKGMKSNLFYAELRQDGRGNLMSLLLHGGGWGHGVGLAQVGAKAQAEAGRSAVEILRSYFPEARLKQRYPGP